MAKLKVFVTPIGFHDAYVAASSQKAALEAWGSDHDLFARGVASLVTDPALAEEPLAAPGRVVKRLRGSAEEQIAAASADRPKRGKRKAPPRAGATQKPAQPLPDRAALDAADAALAEAAARHRQENAAVEAQLAALRAVQAKLRKDQDAEVEMLQRRRDAADAEYRAALKRYRSS